MSGIHLFNRFVATGSQHWKGRSSKCFWARASGLWAREAGVGLGWMGKTGSCEIIRIWTGHTSRDTGALCCNEGEVEVEDRVISQVVIR
jgi:hypothetical protein